MTDHQLKEMVKMEIIEAYVPYSLQKTHPHRSAICKVQNQSCCSQEVCQEGCTFMDQSYLCQVQKQISCGQKMCQESELKPK